MILLFKHKKVALGDKTVYYSWHIIILSWMEGNHAVELPSLPATSVQMPENTSHDSPPFPSLINLFVQIYSH